MIDHIHPITSQQVRSWRIPKMIAVEFIPFESRKAEMIVPQPGANMFRTKHTI